MASTLVRWMGAALCVAAVLPGASFAQLSAGVKVDGVTAQATAPAVNAGATVGSTQLDATVAAADAAPGASAGGDTSISAGSRGTPSGASGSGSRPGSAHATVSAPGTRIRADVGCLAVGAAVAGNRVSVAAGCRAGGDGRAASVAAGSRGMNAVVTLSCLAGRAAVGNSVIRARLGRCSANDVGTAAGEASLAGGLASARAAVGCLRFLAAAGRLFDRLFVSPFALRFYTCGARGASPALTTTAASGQTTLTATVSCVVATVAGNTVNALAEVGSCPGGADRNAADLAAGTGGTSIVGSVGCVAAAAAVANVSAGSCGGAQAAPEPGAAQPPAGSGGNGPAGESPELGSGGPGAGAGDDALVTGASNDETKAAESSSDRGPAPVRSGVKGEVAGNLPMTGLPLWAALFVGLALLAAGLFLVRGSRGLRGRLA